MPETTKVPDYQVKAYITEACSGYCSCIFRANNKEVKFLLNLSTRTAERLRFSPDIDTCTLKVLLQQARLALSPHLAYLKCYISAFRPEWQQVFIDLGFQPTSYLPGDDTPEALGDESILLTWINRQGPSSAPVTSLGKSKQMAELVQ